MALMSIELIPNCNIGGIVLLNISCTTKNAAPIKSTVPTQNADLIVISLANVIEHPPRPVAQIDQTDSSGSDASACSASSVVDRMVYYVDVGNLSPTKADKFLRDLQLDYWSLQPK